ncbi:hypothetical protein BC831DRAFT_262567 [Entophlyctis helioformis]|nr:hypothetical protein BC831DRAFT_262567 [Entophlyctis helioformis]
MCAETSHLQRQARLVQPTPAFPPTPLHYIPHPYPSPPVPMNRIQASPPIVRSTRQFNKYTHIYEPCPVSLPKPRRTHNVVHVSRPVPPPSPPSPQYSVASRPLLPPPSYKPQPESPPEQYAQNNSISTDNNPPCLAGAKVDGANTTLLTFMFFATVRELKAHYLYQIDPQRQAVLEEWLSSHYRFQLATITETIKNEILQRGNAVLHEVNQLRLQVVDPAHIESLNTYWTQQQEQLSAEYEQQVANLPAFLNGQFQQAFSEPLTDEYMISFKASSWELICQQQQRLFDERKQDIFRRFEQRFAELKEQADKYVIEKQHEIESDYQQQRQLFNGPDALPSIEAHKQKQLADLHYEYEQYGTKVRNDLNIECEQAVEQLRQQVFEGQATMQPQVNWQSPQIATLEQQQQRLPVALPVLQQQFQQRDPPLPAPSETSSILDRLGPAPALPSPAKPPQLFQTLEQPQQPVALPVPQQPLFQNLDQPAPSNSSTILNRLGRAPALSPRTPPPRFQPQLLFQAFEEPQQHQQQQQQQFQQRDLSAPSGSSLILDRLGRACTPPPRFEPQLYFDVFEQPQPQQQQQQQPLFPNLDQPASSGSSIFDRLGHASFAPPASSSTISPAFSVADLPPFDIKLAASGSKRRRGESSPHEQQVQLSKRQPWQEQGRPPTTRELSLLKKAEEHARSVALAAEQEKKNPHGIPRD